MYIGGVEGGATQSTLVICDASGKIIGRAMGPSTNHWAVGIPGVAERIATMARAAKAEAKLPEDQLLTAIGLCLSGAETEEMNRELEQYLRAHYPSVAEQYVVCSDTIGSIQAVSRLGGMVIIAGTGSNTLLRNPDGSTHGCGGWGHMIGDEGGAWWISRNAVKTVFDDRDNLRPSKMPVDRVWKLIQQHFGVQTMHDLLEHCYGGFCKTAYAGLCAKLARCALEEADPLCRALFNEAGRTLARSVCALQPKISPELLGDTDELAIVCVGSVWLSWELLREGFVHQLNARCFPYNLRLLRLKTTMALGAAYLAADTYNLLLPRDYTDNYDVFYTYRAVTNGNGTNAESAFSVDHGTNGRN
ncbi:N-acetyl-D-glucosamine kinase isoform X2 [Anopheles cruzii]|uniref:N-acetyl-D-glucosamine kinase isoform X2 n=1 Tax=Anopheles cruzii TaxID=68878 RepID=UPI0022EC749B|nr:N-acetyl-D-glucosamine kinase isoform X2 [Anopheles cruzii]